MPHPFLIYLAFLFGAATASASFTGWLALWVDHQKFNPVFIFDWAKT